MIDIGTLPSVADRKAKARISIEILPEEELFVRQVRAAAVLRGVSLREYVMEALREKWDRERQERR